MDDNENNETMFLDKKKWDEPGLNQRPHDSNEQTKVDFSRALSQLSYHPVDMVLAKYCALPVVLLLLLYGL